MSFIRKILDKHLFKVLGFSIVGVLMTLLSMLLIWVCNDIFALDIYVSYVLVYGLTIILSCILNAHYVWRHTIAFIDVIKYFAIYLSSMILGLGIIYVLELIFPKANHTILTYCALPFTYAWNYCFVNYIFKKNDQ